MSPLGRAHWLWLVPAFLLLAPAGATAKVYRWVDEDGVAHYTIEPEGISGHGDRRLRPTHLVPPAPDSAPDPLSLREAPVPPEPERSSATPPVQEDPTGIRELEAQIARDREALKELISQVGTPGTDFGADPRVREIAERLPRLQAELDALRREAEP